MKTAVLFLRFFVLCFLVLPFALHAQVPEWEDTVQLGLSSNRSVESAFSNGYGQHIGVARTSNSKHYLIGNDGTTIFQSRDLGDSQQGATAVTVFGSYVNVASRHSVASGHDVIWLWRSNDGGGNWPDSIVYDPASNFSNQSITSLDAHADGNGVHIVWESSSEVYYVLYDPNIPAFRFAKQVTDLNPGMGIRPKIVTSASKAHVSFLRSDVNPDAAATRDAIFSTDQGVTWENSYENVPPLNPGSDGVFYQSIARRGDTLHVISYEYHSGGNPAHEIQASKRHINGTSWPQSVDVTTLGLGITDNRRSLTVVGDTVFGVYASFSGNTLRQMVYRPSTGWTTSEIESGSASYEHPTISSSRTGVYFYWHHNSYATAWMKRKVYPISGSVTEPMFWTGNNWVSDDLTIQAGVTVRLKTGSITYVLSGKKIIVQNGATFVMEPGSQLKLETGASLVCYGQLLAVGTGTSSTTAVTFTSSYPQWSGILLSGSGASGSVLQYATIQNVLTYGGSALNILGTNSVLVDHCTFSNNDQNNGTNGIYVGADGFAYISNNTISGHGGSGIKIVEAGADIFLNTLTNNVTSGVNCIQSSPAFGTRPFYSPDGNNSITGGSYGVIAYASYPWIGSVGNTWVGYNSVCGNTKRITASNYSIVSADVNWWGTSSPPESLFESLDQSSIYWENYLGYDPNGTCSGDGPIVNGGNVTLGNTDSSDVIFRALHERNNHNRGNAKRLLQSVLNSIPSSANGLKAALILMHMYRDSSDTEIFDAVMRIWQQRRSTHPLMSYAVAKMLQQQRRVSEAAEMFNAIASANRHSDYEKTALLALFYMYFTSPPHAGQVAGVLQELRSRYPDDGEVKQAAWVYSIAGSTIGFGRGTPERQEAIPTNNTLMQNYPNPFNPTTTIQYSIPKDVHISLVVYDVLGREVAVLESGIKAAGSYSINFDASRLASGVYMYRLEADQFSMIRKMLVVK
jgi:hypothetical protein